MKRVYQATPKWDLERAARRAAFRDGALAVIGGVLLAIVVGVFLLLLFSL